jgi:hypothetical protein
MQWHKKEGSMTSVETLNCLELSVCACPIDLKYHCVSFGKLKYHSSPGHLNP